MNSSASNEICIITDEPITDAPDFDKYSQTISNIIANSVPRFTVGIYGGTTIMRMMRKHLKKYSDVITIWFDAWRYENEQFSALVPVVRTIFLHLEEYVKEMELQQSPKTVPIKNLAKKFKKMGEAILDNSKISAEAGYSGAKASIEVDVNKAKDRYKSGGTSSRTKVESTFINT